MNLREFIDTRVKHLTEMRDNPIYRLDPLLPIMLDAKILALKEILFDYDLHRTVEGPDG